MPIIAIEEQRRAVTVGKIRLGHQVATRSGKTRPAMLDAFRLTSPAEHQIRAAAEVYGGKPHQITDGRLAGQWEVYTPRNALPVVVPNTDSVTQWMEMWSAAGCQRRCDGHTITMRGQTSPCLCPQDPQAREVLAQKGNACKPVTRVSLVLPDLPGMAVWVVESHGINAALEMAQVALSLGLAAERGSFLPAQIRIDHRETRTPGRDGNVEVSKFVVPVLEILTTMRELVEGGTASGQLRLPPAPADMKAITAAPAAQAEPVRHVVADPDDEPVDAEFMDAEPAGDTGWPEVTPPGGAPVGDAESLAARAEAAQSIGEINDLIEEAQKAGLLRAPVGGRSLQSIIVGRARAFGGAR